MALTANTEAWLRWAMAAVAMLVMFRLQRSKAGTADRWPKAAGRSELNVCATNTQTLTKGNRLVTNRQSEKVWGSRTIKVITIKVITIKVITIKVIIFTRRRAYAVSRART
jgi:hypothetical protein